MKPNSLTQTLSRNLPTKRPTRLTLVVILALFLILGVFYSITVPIFEASDELWHYPMVEVIGRTWTLPVQPIEPGTTSGPWRQEGSQQPLYYFLGALLTSWIDTSDMPEVRQPNPHTRAGEITPERDNANLVIHNPERERIGWSGTVLAVHIVRFFSVLLGVWAIWLTWILIHELFPSSDWLALTVTAVHAFTPMYLFISSSVNNDNLIVPLCTWALVLMIRRVKAADGRDLGRELYGADLRLGVVLGLAFLTKTNGLGLLPFVAATLAWETWQLPRTTSRGPRIGYIASHLFCVAAPALAISGWWYYRNIRLYGDLLGWRAFEAVLGTRDVPATLSQLWAERFAFAAGYWGNFGGLNVPMPGWVYTFLNTLTLVAGAGLVIRFISWLLGRSRTDTNSTAQENQTESLLHRVWPFAWRPMTAAHALAWAWPTAIFISWIRWATTTWSSQGRLIFAALPLWSLGLVLGLSAWIPRRVRHWPGLGLGAVLLGLSITALPAWILPAYRPPDSRLTDTLPTGYEPFHTEFGDSLQLLGYRLNTDQVQPGGSIDIDLLWRAQAPTLSYHSMFIHVLGKGDRIIAQRDSFPGHGLLPTTQFEPGRVWEERHILQLPRTAYAPDDLSIAIGLYETATGTRAAVRATTTPQRADAVEFGNVPLVPASADSSLGVRFGDSIVLEGYDLDRLNMQPGEELQITLDWQCTGPIEHDYTVSIQIIDSQWNKAAQSDAWPLEGQRPTTSWEIGETLKETRTLVISPDAVPNAYDLNLTLYRLTPEGNLEHLPISLSSEGMPAKALVLTALRIQE